MLRQATMFTNHSVNVSRDQEIIFEAIDDIMSLASCTFISENAETSEDIHESQRN